MQRLKQRTVYPLLVCSAIVVVSILLAVALSDLTFFRTMELRALDAQFVFRGKVKPSSDIALVVIDRKTYDHIPEVQLFWHPYYAEAIRAAAAGNAKVAAFDIAFTVPVARWEPDHDRMLAEAAAEASQTMPVVIGYVPRTAAEQQEWVVPVNMIMSALGLAGFINLTADSDSFVRRQELIEAADESNRENLARAFSLRIAEKYLNTDARYDGRRLFLKEKRVPLSDGRTMNINFAGPPGTFTSVSMWDFLQAARAGNKKQLHQWVGNKIVLFGVDDIVDRYPTPYYTSFTGKRWTTSGVEIHANTVNTLLTGEHIRGLSPSGIGLALLIVTAGTVAMTAWLSSVAAGFLVTGLWASIVLIGHIVFRFGLAVPVVELLIACSSSMILTGIYRLSTAQKRSELFGRALSVFVGRDVASALDQSGNFSLSGKYQFVTILFSDIRGFTSFCEEKDPALVVEVLNKYLAQMVSIIRHNGGTVNKFIGDGILAVFADDDEGSVPGDHPLRAVKTGIAMCQADTGFQTGVGIHSGVVVIGNVGSADRLEFTVLGDTVNVASRLEGLNKEQHTSLLFSEATHGLLDGAIDAVLLGSVALRGQSRNFNIYTASSLVPTRVVAGAQA